MKKENKQAEDEKDKSVTSVTAAAHEEAEKDMESDPDLNDKPDPAKDLDEGELARLEGED